MRNRKGKEWTSSELKRLKEYAKQGKTTPSIANKLGRTTSAIYLKASEKNISLKPKDK